MLQASTCKPAPVLTRLRVRVRTSVAALQALIVPNRCSAVLRRIAVACGAWSRGPRGASSLCLNHLATCAPGKNLGASDHGILGPDRGGHRGLLCPARERHRGCQAL